MKAIGLLFIFFLSIGFCCYGQNPASHPDAIWSINDAFTDEFNTGQLDTDKWNHDPNDWGTWSWEPENAWVTDTALTLQMVHKSHMRGGQEYHFTSGIVRNEETITYGYFEARIKASAKGQGTCPAFWIYSIGQPTPNYDGGVKYSEIDIVEIFQIPYDTQRLEMNLHTRIWQDGQLIWIRPGQYPELTHNTWLAPWDPRDEYHTYGVWNRLDSIFWYVDGVQRGAKKNHYWHLPMHTTVSLGLRTPYEKYINGVRTVMPYPDSIPEPGFPTEAYCDYVRVWNTDAQLYADREKYYNAAFFMNYDLQFDCRYFAGNGETVIEDGWNGVTCKLQEIDDTGAVIQEFDQVDDMAVGEESGKAEFQFSLSGLMPSASLPTGHQYILRPAFRTSLNGGEDVFLEEEYYPITILEPSSVNSQEAKEKIKIINRADGVAINMTDVFGDAKVMVYDLAGRQLFFTKISANNALIDRELFPTTGIYMVSVMTGNLHRVEKVAIMGN